MPPAERLPLARQLAAFGRPLVAELERVLAPFANGDPAGALVELEHLGSRHGVRRVRAAVNGTVRSVIIKRLQPGAAERNRLVAGRWLPWLGLDGVAPTLLGASADAGGEAIWQIFEDVGGVTLAELSLDRARVSAAVDLVAELHTRAAGHPVVAECRRDGRALGMPYFTANVSDARALLDALRPPTVHPSRQQAEVRDRLRGRLDRLLAEAPRRAGLMEAEGGPDTMLHGDLFTANIIILEEADRLRVRLIDWDHAGAGPACYDLSTLLWRFGPAERHWILDRYRAVVALAGWHLPSLPVFNALCDTTERARCSDRILWPALALLHDGADWAWLELETIDGWFEALQPVIPA